MRMTPESSTRSHANFSRAVTFEGGKSVRFERMKESMKHPKYDYSARSVQKITQTEPRSISTMK